MTDSRFAIEISAKDKYSEAVEKAEKTFRKMLGPVHEYQEKFEKIAKATGFERGVEHARQLGEAVDKVTEKLGGIERPMIALTGAGSLTGIAALAIGWGEMGEKVEVASRNIGISGELLQSHMRAAELAGISSDVAASGLQTLGDTLQDAAFGRNPQVLNLMAKLGMHSERTASGAVDVAQGMGDLADQIKRFEGHPQIQREIAGAFGVVDMLPLLRRGREGIADFQREVEKTGAIMSDQNQEKASKFTETVRLFGYSLVGLKNELGSDLSGTTPFIKAASEAIGGNSGYIAHASEAIAVTTGISSAIWALPKAITAARFAMAPLGLAVSGASKLVSGGLFAGGLAADAVGLGSLSGSLMKLSQSANMAVGGLTALGMLSGATVAIYDLVEGLKGLTRLPKDLRTLAQSETAQRTGIPQAVALLHDHPSLGMAANSVLHSAFPWLSSVSFGSGGESRPSGSARPVRNHNPWDLRGWNPSGRHDAAGFDMFDNDDEGIIAASRQLMTDQREGVNTIGGIVAKASPSSDGNNTAGMIRKISQDSGFAADQQLNLSDPEVQKRLLPAIFKQENGNANYDNGQIWRDILTAVQRMADNPPSVAVHVDRDGGTRTVNKGGITASAPVGEAMPVYGP